MIKHWELMEQYNKQGERFRELRERYVQKEREAKEHVQNLKAQYEACIHKELREGKDCTTEKDKLRKQIADAEKAVELAEQERVQAFKYIDEGKVQADRITVAHLAEDYLQNHLPAIRAEEVDPIVERLKAARAEYFNCILDLFEVKDRYQQFVSQFAEMVNRYYYSGNHGARPYIPHVFEAHMVPFINDHELSAVMNYRQLPPDVKRVTTTEKQ